MFRKTYGYMLRHPATQRGYWGNWYYRRRYEKVLEELSKLWRCNDTTLLDFGCGLGFYARYLEEKRQKCRYVGCDIDDDSLKAAYRGNNSDYVKCDVQQSPFREKSVPIVLCSEVLEHLPLPYVALEGISRIATEALIVTFPEEPLLLTFRDGHPEHISVIVKECVARFLTSKGFNVVQISYIFNSFIPCGVLEFMHVPRNRFTQKIVSAIDKLLVKMVPRTLVPHKTVMIEAKAPLL